ncbi:MAG TPA: SIS domain-containing protein [Polyangiaceae bacterium]|jgi:arabinose-5-phosphate isomerase
MTEDLARMNDFRVAARPDGAVAAARSTLAEGARVLEELGRRLDVTFRQAVELVLSCQGRLVVSGVGRSGLVAREIASAFASAGTPSLFLNAGEAAHGDLGVVMPGDVVLLVSVRERERELMVLLPFFEAQGIATIALVGRAGSELASAADVALEVGRESAVYDGELEATLFCLAMLALGSALALSVRQQRDAAETLESERQSGVRERTDMPRRA